MYRKKHGLYKLQHCLLFQASIVGLGPYLPSWKEFMNLSGAPTQTICWPEVCCSSLPFPSLPKCETLKTTTNISKYKAQLSKTVYKNNLKFTAYVAYGYLFFLDKKTWIAKTWHEISNFSILWEATRSEKWRIFELEGVLDIWIDIKHKHSSTGCICSFWTFWYLCYLRSFVSLWEHKAKIPCGYFSIIYQRQKTCIWA